MSELRILIEQSGVKELIFAVLSAVFLYTGYAIKNIKINFRSKKFQFNQHQIFNNLRNTIREVETWNVPDNKIVFKDALLVKFKIWLNTGLDFTKQLQTKKVNRINLETEFLNWLETAIKGYISDWDKIKIPKNVIRYINSEHQNKINRFTTKIHNISTCKHFINNYIKTNVILETLDTLLAETKADFLTITYMKNLNGRFINDTYKGIPISDTIT